MNTGLHHAEKRAKQGKADGFDRAMILIGSIGPLSLVPQVLKLWTEKSVQGISPVSWILLSIVSFLWVVYGLKHRSNALVVSNALAVIMNLAVVSAFFFLR